MDVMIVPSLMMGLGGLFYWTWFIWPFLFVFSLAFGVSYIIKNDLLWGKGMLAAAGLSLTMIICGLSVTLFT